MVPQDEADVLFKTTRECLADFLSSFVRTLGARLKVEIDHGKDAHPSFLKRGIRNVAQQEVDSAVPQIDAISEELVADLRVKVERARAIEAMLVDDAMS